MFFVPSSGRRSALWPVWAKLCSRQVRYEDLETCFECSERSLPSSPFDHEALAVIALVRTRGHRFDDGESSPGVRCLAVAMVA